MSVPLRPSGGGTAAPSPVWLPEGVFCVPGALAEEDCGAWPSCGRVAAFWREGADDARGGDAGGGSPAPSSNAANGPLWSVDSADGALLRALWLRLAWRAALAS